MSTIQLKLGDRIESIIDPIHTKVFVAVLKALNKSLIMLSHIDTLLQMLLIPVSWFTC